MKTKTKKFTLAQVLNITTSRLLTEMGDIYEVLNWMTDDNLFTHQLPRAMKECQPVLFKLFPELQAVRPEELDEYLKGTSADPAKIVKTWVADLKESDIGLKDYYDVPRINDHKRVDPISELAGMIGPERVVVVAAPEK
jgi:hypothetical protein